MRSKLLEVLVSLGWDEKFLKSDECGNIVRAQSSNATPGCPGVGCLGAVVFGVGSCLLPLIDLVSNLLHKPFAILGYLFLPFCPLEP